MRVTGGVTFPTSVPLSGEVRDLVVKLLRPDPELRISVPEIEVRFCGGWAKGP